MAADFTATIATNVTDYFWDLGDGTVISNSPAISHVWTNAGDYSLIVSAYDGLNGASISSTSVVHIIEDITHYVSLSSTNPIAPYISWETAATNIQDAIDSAVNSMVLVSNGVYEVGRRGTQTDIEARVVITKPIIVASVNGPEVTTIKGRWTSQPDAHTGPDALRCVYLTNGAALLGFTVTGGDTDINGTGGGIWCESSTALVSNCIVTANGAANGGGM